MKEARLMRKYNHKHVVKILGVAVHEHPLMLVMEVCPNGSLLSYLRKNKGSTALSEKLRFSTEASDGLAYLEKKLCIHRDIAARNCLLGAKYEIKIADFGMSDDKVIVHDDTLEKVPVKWLAPETLQDKIYSLKTDVWSYGVLVWEIYADGAEPYPGLTRLQTRAKIVVQNYRMEMPKDTPKSVADIVYSCWEKDPARRPEMSRIFRMLREIGERSRSGN
ncbi:protein tyrosine kinase [Teladorsagia circumcincta]|uniref:Protein tyrosine kinase n=1 Tax=Teladorsagia circumcincta TaxID=45464 RepID=A0A2G9UNG5_TELCI|nr:protein tyrosine kinase [Teladorsagia circumcincta]